MCVPVCMHVCAHMCTHLDPFWSSPGALALRHLLPFSSYQGPALLSRQGHLRGYFPPALCMRLVRLPSELWAWVDFLILWMGRGRVPRTQPAAWYRVQPHPARSPSKAFYHGPGGPNASQLHQSYWASGRLHARPPPSQDSLDLGNKAGEGSPGASPYLVGPPAQTLTLQKTPMVLKPAPTPGMACLAPSTRRIRKGYLYSLL